MIELCAALMQLIHSSLHQALPEVDSSDVVHAGSGWEVLPKLPALTCLGLQ